MNYTLARKLKDAGFPQDEHDDDFIGKNYDETVSNPTLSELIEACGNKKEDAYFSLSYGRDKWYAMFDVCDYSPLDNLCGEGATPDEAVSNLYLSLNAPKSLPI